ncbi:unnamed protein product, partial [Vitis vinifera]|uniref:Uncharacterized protein n=1 Tax=Vitis vinifera TaxID=29760 RepID=D7U5X7_VITVI
MDERISGLNLNGRKMRTWLGNGTTPRVSGMETRMIKVSKQMRTTDSMLYQLSSLNSTTKIRL